MIAANQWLCADPKLAAENIAGMDRDEQEAVYIFLGPSGNMTTDPTIKPALIDAAASDVKVLQNLGRMKDFDPKKWVDDSYIRKAYSELKLDYDAELASTRNYEISGEDKFCKKPITDPHKSGEVWVDDEGILPFSSAMCTLGAYADFKAKGKKIDVTYVFDTARGIKLFADQAFFAVGRRRHRAVPAEEGRRGLRRQEPRQGAGLPGRRQGRHQRGQDVSSPALVRQSGGNHGRDICQHRRGAGAGRCAGASTGRDPRRAARWYRLNRDNCAPS